MGAADLREAIRLAINDSSATAPAEWPFMCQFSLVPSLRMLSRSVIGCQAEQKAEYAFILLQNFILIAFTIIQEKPKTPLTS